MLWAPATGQHFKKLPMYHEMTKSKSKPEDKQTSAEILQDLVAHGKKTAAN